MILREKTVRGYFFWAIGVPKKKLQILKKILKKHHTGQFHKKSYNFCSRRRKSHFSFTFTHPVCDKNH